MKKYDLYCLISSILSLVPIIFLMVAFFPVSFLYDNDTAVISLGAISFGLALIAFYFAIPYYDDETSEKRAFNHKFTWGISVGSIGLLLAILFTPLVFLAWSTNGLQSLIALVS